jgi:hypothetical protein
MHQVTVTFPPFRGAVLDGVKRRPILKKEQVPNDSLERHDHGLGSTDGVHLDHCARPATLRVGKHGHCGAATAGADGKSLEPVRQHESVEDRGAATVRKVDLRRVASAGSAWRERGPCQSRGGEGRPERLPELEADYGDTPWASHPE